MLFAALAHPLSPGKYTDYVYGQAYAPPSPPANKTELSCEFFSLSENSCALLGLAPAASRESILFAIIRKQLPEQNQDWARYWNSRLPIGRYYEEAGDGAEGENGSLKSAWMRLIDIYPSVFDPRDNYTYLPKQVLVNAKTSLGMVVPTPPQEGICAQNYNIGGYDFELEKSIKSYSTKGQIIPVDRILAEGEKANLTLELHAESRFSYNISRIQSKRECDAFGSCQDGASCEPAEGESKEDTLNITKTFAIKRYPDNFSYQNTIVVPKRGYAQGTATAILPSDFLFYEVRVKDAVFRVQKNDLRYMVRGDYFPVITLALQPAPARLSSMRVVSLDERDDGATYRLTLHYKVYVDRPDIGPADCKFVLHTPFAAQEMGNACESTVVQPVLMVQASEGGSVSSVVAQVKDPLGNPIEGAEVEFGGGIPASRSRTGADGMANISVPRRESVQTVEAKVVGSEDYAGANAIAYVQGTGVGGARLDFGAFLGWAAPILLIIIVVSALVVVVKRRREAWGLVAVLFLAALALMPALSAAEYNGTLSTGLQATIDACKTYDFDNAIRHLGECTEAYRLSTEFDAMKSTVNTLIANIAPLVVANPDVTPYREAYASMGRIALSLLRVAWSSNSLYLIMNVFNPVKRNQALMQFIWLLVFVPSVSLSFGVVQNPLTLVNAVTTWVAGPDAAATLLQANQSIEFIAENYEMLKLILPFLNLTYLILLARYIMVIGALLFFPFTLLLFFTTATRGFGRAAITVTFAAIGLGVVNAVLMLIYNILSKTPDPVLSSTFSTTFFSASFLIFFGFINLFGLAVSFLSGIIFIGQSKQEG